jgi:hypothetical protein
MSIQGKFEADQNGQVILGEGGSQAPNVYVVVHVDTGAIELSGQYLHAEHRTGISNPDNGPHDLSPINLHKGQSAVVVGYFVKVVGKKAAGEKTEYGAGKFEVTNSI